MPEAVTINDDEQAIRELLKAELTSAGYRVLSAGNLAQAQTLAAEHPQLRLLITDYHLENGETGIQVIESLRAVLGEDLKAVLVTGDTSAAVKELQRDARLRLASKPIRADELLELMRSLLDS